MSMPHLKRIEESADPIFNRGSALVLDHWTNRSLSLFSSDSHYFQRIFFFFLFFFERSHECTAHFLSEIIVSCVCEKPSQVRGQVLPGYSPWQSTCACFLIFPCRGQRTGERWKPKQRLLVWTLVWVRVWVMRVSDSRHRTRMRVSLWASAACKWAPLTTNRTCAMPRFSHHSGMSRGKRTRKYFPNHGIV